MGATPPAGWYDDPEGSDSQRWWDGSGWTDRLAPPMRQTAEKDGRRGLRPLAFAVVGLLVVAVAAFAGWTIADSDEQPTTDPSQAAGEDGGEPAAGGSPAGPPSGAPADHEQPPRIAAFVDATCLVTTGGAVECWGGGAFTGAWEEHPTPVTLPGYRDATGVLWAGAMPCVLERQGFGCVWSEDLGIDADLRDFAERELSDAVAVVGGGGCARYADGRAACLRVTGDVSSYAEAWHELPGVEDVIAIDAGDDHVCVVDRDGGAYCWEDWWEGSGEVGPPTRLPSESTFVDVATVDTQTCVLDEDGRVFCLVSGDEAAARGMPDPSLLQKGRRDDIVALVAGGETAEPFFCGLHADGSVSCWGANYRSQRADGTDETRSTPVQVVGVADAVEITAGREHACARLAGGGSTCWGDNTSGQLGIGTVDPDPDPEPEAEPENVD